MTLLPFLPVPVVMEPSSSSTAGYLGGESGSTGLSVAYTPFLYNGNLHIVLQQVGPDFGVSFQTFVYQSTDQGATWAPLDAANGPIRVDETPGAGFVFDGDHTIIVAWSPTGGPLTGVGPWPVNLQNFNLLTETWGAPYGTVGAPTVNRIVINQCVLRPDGSILVLTNRTSAGLGVVGLQAHVYSGGVWTVSFDVDTNVAGSFVSNGNSAAVMDSTGNVHVFGTARDGTSQELFYQLVKSDNTLGTFAVIQVGTPNLPGISQEFQPAISGDNVIIGLNDPTGIAYATIAVGTPLSAPVFTVLGSPGIDPAGPGVTVSRLFPAVIAVDATGIYAAYIIDQTGILPSLIRLCGNPNITTPLVGWNDSILAYDTDASGLPSNVAFLGLARDGGNQFATMAQAGAGFGDRTQYWLGVFTPATAAFRVALYGYKRFKNRPVCAPDLVELPEVPPVKRVL